jgi:rare lipoprotein A (peptidoglycan hydrolase)
MASCGTASWYHEGSQTANGERYRPDGISAAHKTLPFGTRVLVRNQRTGRTVTVRINDRGPFIKGRIIDLSRGAKRVLGMDGLASVCLTVLGRGERYADAGEGRAKRVSKKSRVARNTRVRNVYRTTQTSARFDDDPGPERKVTKRRSTRKAQRSRNTRAAERREYRQRRAERQARRQEESSTFRLAGWPGTAFSSN